MQGCTLNIDTGKVKHVMDKPQVCLCFHTESSEPDKTRRKAPKLQLVLCIYKYVLTRGHHDASKNFLGIYATAAVFLFPFSLFRFWFICFIALMVRKLESGNITVHINTLYFPLRVLMTE